VLSSLYFQDLSDYTGLDNLQRLQSETLDLLLQSPVGLGDTLVLPEMFQPRFDEECFHEPAPLRYVLENAPRVSAVPVPFSGQVLQRR
jgi:hypothetical protein